MKELTPKEAIKILRPDTSRDALWKIEYYAGFNAEKARLKAVEDACVVACEALEKQIPKKPVFVEYTDKHEDGGWVCPVCGGTVGVYVLRDNWCSDCGMKIDWSE